MKFKTLLIGLLISSAISITTFAKDIPEYYSDLPKNSFYINNIKNRSSGEIFKVISGIGKEVYYKMIDETTAQICTPDGILLTYEEINPNYQDKSEISIDNEETTENFIENKIENKKESTTEILKNQSPIKNDISESNITLAKVLGDISRGNHKLAPYSSSKIIVPRPANSKYNSISKTNINNINLQDINGHWAEKYIKEFVSKGYISGYPDNTFKPNDYITYAELTSIFAKFNLKPVRWKGGDFNLLFKNSTNVKSSDWYYDTALISSEAGFFPNSIIQIQELQKTIQGEKSVFNLYELKDYATRQYVCMFLANMVEPKESDLIYNLTYYDKSQINSYTDNIITNSVKRLVNNNIISGYPDNTFKPNNKITRAETVVMLAKILDMYDWNMENIHDNLYANYYMYMWQQETELLNLVNNERKEKEINTLEYNADLHALAEIKGIDKMINGYDNDGGGHVSKHFGRPQEMADKFGINVTVGENALQGGIPAIQAHKRWYNSSEHHNNYLDKGYNIAGFCITENCSFEMLGGI